jgi:ATP-dependent exoDNAse (exonuclease V) alpha subunit
MSVAYRNPWTAEEDFAVNHLVAELGSNNWALLAKRMASQFHIVRRSGKQCRERWYNHLSPDVDKRPWTEEEDDVIVDLYKKVGKRWTTIANQLPGRTDNSVKNRFYSCLRRKIRKFSRKKNNQRKIDEAKINLSENKEMSLGSHQENESCTVIENGILGQDQGKRGGFNAFLAFQNGSEQSRRNETSHESSLLGFEEEIRLLSLYSMTFNYFCFYQGLESYRKMMESGKLHEFQNRNQEIHGKKGFNR